MRCSRTAQRVLELHASLRSVGLLHGACRRAQRELRRIGPNECHRAPRAAHSPPPWAAADASDGGGDRHSRRWAWPVSPPRSRARDSATDLRRECAALADLGDPAVPGRRNGAPCRRRCGRCPPRALARASAVGRFCAGGVSGDCRTHSMAGARAMALVVHVSVDRRDHRPRARPADALSRREHGGCRGAWRLDACLGTRRPRPRRVGGARSRGAERSGPRGRSAVVARAIRDVARIRAAAADPFRAAAALRGFSPGRRRLSDRTVRVVGRRTAHRLAQNGEFRRADGCR